MKLEIERLKNIQNRFNLELNNFNDENDEILKDLKNKIHSWNEKIIFKMKLKNKLKIENRKLKTEMNLNYLFFLGFECLILVIITILIVK